MGKIIEAKAVISAEDRTGKTFDQIARKFKEVGKGAKVSAEIDRMSKSLKTAQENLRGLNDYQGKRSAFYTARNDMVSARKAADLASRALANAAKPTRELQDAMRKTQKAVDRTTEAFERQKAEVLGARRTLTQGGLTASGMVRQQVELGKAIDRTSRAIGRQHALAKAEGGLAEGMSSAGRRQHARIAQDRYLIEGMGAAGRASIAERDRRQQAIAEAKSARREDRVEAAKTLGAGVAVMAAHKGKEIAKSAIESAAEFDLAVRKQRVFTDISPDAQGGLLSQAKQIGQETQFSNIDVVKAQTAAMQGLPASFAPDLKAAVAQGIVGNVRNFSTLMETDLKDGTEIIRGYLQQSGKDISTKEKALKEANKATNQLVKMAKLGGMDGEDVKHFTNYGISAATSAGISTEATMALGALARRGGLRGDVAGVAVRSMASKIVSPTTEGLAALNAAGIKYSNYVHMPDKLDTNALEGQFQMKMGKGFTPAVRAKVDAVNKNKDLIADRNKYTQAIVSATSPMLGKTKNGTVRASDAKIAAKAAGQYHKLSAGSVDAEGLLDAAMSSNMSLAQLNAWLTDKHGGKGAITQRQWDEFKTSKAAIGHAAEDPDWAKKKADEVFAGLGGAVENLKGSFENLILTVGNVNAPLIKWSADALGNGLDSFSKLPEGAQQGLSLGAGAGLTAFGSWGSLLLTKRLLGLGGNAAAGAGAGAVTGTGAGTAGAGAGAKTALGGAGLAGLGLSSIAFGTMIGAAFSAYATSQTMPKLAAEQGAAGIDYATGGGMDANPMAGLAPERPWLRDWLRANAPTWLGGDASGQKAAINNDLDKAATASSTAANGGKPVEATVKPDQITAKVTEIPPVTGTVTETITHQHNHTIELKTDMLDARIRSISQQTVKSIPLASSGARPGAVSMPGAASTPGAQ